MSFAVANGLEVTARGGAHGIGGTSVDDDAAQTDELWGHPASASWTNSGYLAGKGPDELLFTSARGLVLRNRNARRDWFDDAAEAIGEKGLTPHGLRHNLFDGDLDAVADRLDTIARAAGVSPLFPEHPVAADLQAVRREAGAQ